MDYQAGIVARVADQAASLTAAVRRAVDFAHEQSIPVFFVRVAFREGAPEISSDNQMFAALKTSMSMEENGPNTQLVDGLGRNDTDALVTKRRVSAFSGSDLDVLLRACGARSLVLCGIATGGCVLSTVRQAADLDYSLTVLSDACADADPEVHNLLITKVFPRQATVVTSAEWVGLSRA
jgi:nicotinamidase-related amidase